MGDRATGHRLYGLDGLRAIAILVLVLGHCSQADFWYGTSSILTLPLPKGCLSILFVLSGFFAGLFAEKNVTDIKSYYSNYIPAPVRNEFFGIIAAGLILCSVSDKPLIRFRNKIWRFLSKISYNLYVIHILIVILVALFFSALYEGKPIPSIMSICAYIIMVGLSILAAWGTEKVLQFGRNK